jgi:hypothetical protein
MFPMHPKVVYFSVNVSDAPYSGVLSLNVSNALYSGVLSLNLSDAPYSLALSPECFPMHPTVVVLSPECFRCTLHWCTFP